jgi:hypothetical protein
MPGRTCAGRAYYTDEQCTRALKVKAVEQLPMGTDSPCCTRDYHPYTGRRSRSFSPWGNGSTRAGAVKSARSARSAGQNRFVFCALLPRGFGEKAGLFGWSGKKRGCGLSSEASLRGGVGRGSRACEGRTGFYRRLGVGRETRRASSLPRERSLSSAPPE